MLYKPEINFYGEKSVIEKHGKRHLLPINIEVDSPSTIWPLALQAVLSWVDSDFGRNKILEVYNLLNREFVDDKQLIKLDADKSSAEIIKDNTKNIPNFRVIPGSILDLLLNIDISKASKQDYAIQHIIDSPKPTLPLILA